MELPSLYTGIILITIGFVGVLENGYVIYVYARSTHLRDTSMKVIASLAITDFFSALVICIDGALITSQGNDGALMESYPACISILMVVEYMLFVSQLVLGVTTLDRYIAICHHGRYTRIMTTKTVYILLVLSWTCPAPIILTAFFGFNNWDEIQACSYPNLLHEWVYKTFSSILFLLMTTSAILYINIMFKAWEFYRGFRPAQVQGINTASQRVRARQRAIKNGKVMAIITLTFIICWLPFHILQYQFHLKYNGSFLYVTCAFSLGSLNCIINPFLYAWQRKDLRKEATSYIHFCRRGTEEEQNDNNTQSTGGTKPTALSNESEFRSYNRHQIQTPAVLHRYTNTNTSLRVESNAQHLLPRVDI